jgi:hypothetical protein
VNRFAFLLALLLPACVNQETVDYAFCDADEACFSVVEPDPVVCNGVTCSGLCGVAWGCQKGPGGTDVCVVTEEMPGKDDGDLCTYDLCKGNDHWIHVPITAAEMDDGNECTIDECKPASGVYHVNTCG